MENCVRCGVDGEKVRLFDAIYESRMENICERCSIIENVPIIKKPTSNQLKQAENEVYKRMQKLTGYSQPEKRSTFFVEDRLKELDSSPELELPQKEKLNLIDYFHWEIMKNRRRKGLSQKQLGETIGESEIAIQMIEKGKLPENADVLIKKLEQFFQLRLRKITEMEMLRQRQKQKFRTEPALLDGEGHELDSIPEPEIKQTERETTTSDVEILEDEINLIEEVNPNVIPEEKNSKVPVEEVIEEEKDYRGVDLEKGEVNLNEANLNSLKIKDLQDIHKKKVQATKNEQIEEKRRIEERNKLIEARKEELRIRREKESQELDNVLGGSELLNTDFEE